MPKWVKFIIAILLLPICFGAIHALWLVFRGIGGADRTLVPMLAGAACWICIFVLLPKPMWIYVFGHELTHALWVWLMGGRVSRFKVGREGGHILTDKNNFLIALAPYFFPLYSILVIALYGALSLFVNMQPYGRLLYALIGGTWAFHLTFTCWMIPKNQSDLSDNGTIFSLVVIYLIHLLLLSAMLIIASPHITFASFGADILRNIANFSHAIVGLCERFSRGP